MKQIFAVAVLAVFTLSAEAQYHGYHRPPPNGHPGNGDLAAASTSGAAAGGLSSSAACGPYGCREVGEVKKAANDCLANGETVCNTITSQAVANFRAQNPDVNLTEQEILMAILFSEEN